MRVVHFSDLHWAFMPLPHADLYVCTGDMLDNYPSQISEEVCQPFQVPYRRWGIDPKHERKMQAQAIEIFVAKRGFRELFGSPDAPVICVAGNHDFVDIAPLFRGCNFIHEFHDNERIELCGMRIAGHTGIPWIFGSWNHEMSRADLLDRVRRMPPADMYLTHYPPSGLSLDGKGIIRYGLDGMLNDLLYRHESQRPSPSVLHLFGHIHECGGMTEPAGPILFSNAATTYNVLEGSPDEGWQDVSPP